MTSQIAAGDPRGRQSNPLGTAALVATLCGGGGSLGLMLYVSRRNRSVLLTLLFAGWVIFPFAALAWANVVSKRWPALCRTTLRVMTIVVALISLGIYGNVAARTRVVRAAAYFLMVPPASSLMTLTAVGITALMSRRTQTVAAAALVEGTSTDSAR